MACSGLVGGLESRTLGLRSENLEKPYVFLGFWEGRPIGNIPLLSSGLPASGAVFLFFKVFALNRKKSF